MAPRWPNRSRFKKGDRVVAARALGPITKIWAAKRPIPRGSHGVVLNAPEARKVKVRFWTGSGIRVQVVKDWHLHRTVRFRTLDEIAARDIRRGGPV